MSPFIDMNDTDAHEKHASIKDLVLLRSLMPYIRPHWKLFLISVLVLPLVSFTQVIQPYIVKRIIDGPVAAGDLHGLLSWSLLFMGVLVVAYGTRYVQMILAQITGQHVVHSVRTALFNHLQSLSPRFYNKTPIGLMVTRVSSDVENISEMFAQGGIAILGDFIVIFGIIIAMFLMNVKLAMVTVVIVPILVVTMEFFRRRSRESYNAMRVELARINSNLQESLTGMDVIHLLRRERWNLQKFRVLNMRFLRTNFKSIFYDSAFTASVEVLALLTMVLVVGVFAWLTVHHASAGLSFGLLVAYLQYVQMLYEPIEDLSDKFTIIQSGLASMEKIVELMSIEPEIQDPPQPILLSNPLQGHIRFENVTFGYSADKPILRNFNLEIRPGEKVALVGTTGAGKSTVIRLINRQYDPQEGVIKIDGHDIRQYSLHDLRRNTVVIPQEEFLFSRTVEDNITMSYKTPVPQEALVAVSRTVHADRVVRHLEKGYQTMLPERGRSLSNGQRQLIVFARALWHQPSILILDEATSAIDPQTESWVQDALDRIMKDRTAIIIAHRLSTIQQVDTIHVIENGQVVESGSPQALYEASGRYRHYHDQHFSK